MIGKGGETIKRIAGSVQCQISLAQKEASSALNERIVTIVSESSDDIVAVSCGLHTVSHWV